jgi:hypothetical protein
VEVDENNNNNKPNEFGMEKKNKTTRKNNKIQLSLK